jgi:hypothetical protein
MVSSAGWQYSRHHGAAKNCSFSFQGLDRGRSRLNRKGDQEMDRALKIRKCLSLLGASAFLSVSLVASPVPQQQSPAPDNTKTNQGDSNKGAVTADQQNMNPTDRNITKQIRSAIYKDKSLSTYAHNI